MDKGQLGVAAAVLLGVVGTSEAQIVLPGVVNRWSADGNAEDSEGSADGTVEGDVVYGPGKFRGAFEFSGGGRIDFGADVGNFDADFTISLWLRTPVSDSRAVIGKRDNCDGNEAWFEIRSGRYEPGEVLFELHGLMGGGDLVGGRVDDNQWHHLAMRRQGDSFSAHLDGESLGPRSVRGRVLNSAPFLAGDSTCGSNDGTQPLIGLLDEIQFYDRALDDDEIVTLATDPGCIADLNQNGEVEFSDLLILLGFWGECDCPADLDLNGIVDFSDLLFLLSVWGPCE